MARPNPTAFALGGLAGNNAHGAGFLQAALDQQIKPAMISCTSGQICWVFHYLQALESGGQRAATQHLRSILQDEIASVHQFGNINLDCTAVAAFGRPGVFRPAYIEAFSDMVVNGINACQKLMERCGNVFVMKEWLGLFPCRTLVPERPGSFFEEVAASFDASGIGIVFNSYNPQRGEEYVYLNAAARRLLRQRPGAVQDRRNGTRHRFRRHTVYRDIDADAVRSGLWLYAYGFDRKQDRYVDGAYFREIILAELTYAHRIYVVRPLSYCWRDNRLPHSYPEIEDLKTGVGFNGAYQGERYQIEMVNQLRHEKAFDKAHSRKYHHIDLQDIEIHTQRGYFDYVFESMDVFDDAYGQTTNRFARIERAAALTP